ncbi:hypothetical protein CK203_077324 [Vitis vinifera]|uniref:Uncharacterized protein n=1 Tax=Vitis vinifera TaxID=29760 RepID=A0A438EX09_VITVI|nr:hypothetical protein CK203_077324 [Vitis vinifera]
MPVMQKVIIRVVVEVDYLPGTLKGVEPCLEDIDHLVMGGGGNIERRGISRFYNGKSKSFTSLADASTSASKDLAKPENAYNRRRRNLLAYNHVLDKNRNFPLRSNGGGISKKLAATSRSTLALAVAMSSSDSNNSSEDLNSSLNCISRSPSLLLPPLHPQARLYHNNVSSSPPQRNLSAWRSYSLADLQQCATSGTTNATSSPISRGADDHSKANLSPFPSPFFFSVVENQANGDSEHMKAEAELCSLLSGLYYGPLTCSTAKAAPKRLGQSTHPAQSS